MPRSKRSKKVSLTKTKKKGLEIKHKAVEEIRTAVDKHENIYVFSYENMKNNLMREVRQKWKSNSRFFFSKNKVMALGLGRTSAEEVSENLHLISVKLVGDRGLFFTNAPKDEVLKFFDTHKILEYCRGGAIATETVQLEEGLLNQFPHNIEPYLRKLGLPTELRRGIPALIKPYIVCKEGETLSPEQAQVLKLLEIKMAYFKITMEYIWSKGGFFEDLCRSNVVARVKPARKPREPKKKPAGDSKKDKIDSEGEKVESEEEENESEKVDRDEMESSGEDAEETMEADEEE